MNLAAGRAIAPNRPLGYIAAMTWLITGVAGFIGYHVAEALLARGEAVLGIDNLNDYYAVELKRARLSRLGNHNRFEFRECDIAEFETLRQVVKVLQPRQVIGVGQFAEDRARSALADGAVEFGRILHPSPASPAANRGWAAQAERQLEQLGVLSAVSGRKTR